MASARMLLAAIITSAAPAAHAGDWGGIFSALTYVSDYRYQGISSTDLRPAVQGYAHWQRADGVFAGVFASQVNYYAGGPKLEVDTYAGKHFQVDGGRTEITPELLYSVFPANRTPGPTFDFLEMKLEAKRRRGPFTFVATAAATPQASYGAGEAWLGEGEADYALTPRVTLKAMAGRRWVRRGVDRNYWSVGASMAFGKATPAGRRFQAELKYQDTNLNRAQCGFNPRICSAALVGSLTVNLPPIL